jgi:MFS transporter, PAT family, beta-lactamase induction signal transducer AmpG
LTNPKLSNQTGEGTISELTPNTKPSKRNPWAWIPTLYFAEGIPYILVMFVSGVMYKRLGESNTDITLYTSLLYLPWVIKPFWAPVVDILKTKRWWIVIMELTIGACTAGVALAIPINNFFRYTLALFWLIAFGSATHDISADGFYMLGLPQHEQAFFVGIRSTFYRLAMITGQGLLVILAGQLETSLKNVPLAWEISILVMAGLFLSLYAYHKFILPYPNSDKPVVSTASVSSAINEFFVTFKKFFIRDKILSILGFIMLYRLGEAQLVKISPLFLLDAKTVGGLGLSTSEVGIIYGTVGVISLTIGGILGGIVAAKQGLKYWIWWMLIAINLPDLVYVYLSFTQSSNLFLVNALVAVEQFGYGFGFTAFMLYLIYISEGDHSTSHYAIATGLMALGMMIPGMFSGWLQHIVGYKHFFVLVCILTIPAFIITKFVPIDPEFGKKQTQN